MKNYAILISACVMVSTLCTTVQAQETLIPESKQSFWEQFKSSEGESWEIRWRKDSPVPRSVTGGVSKAYEGTPETIARQFLMDYSDLFSMKNGLSNFYHEETITSIGTHTVVLKQYHNGVPVEGGEYRVHIQENGSVDMVNGHYYPNISISTESSISSDAAISVGKSDLMLSGADENMTKAELVIYPQNDSTFTLTYKTQLYSNEPLASWLYYVDAHTGEILKKGNRLSHFTKEASPMVTGSGSVYASHPGSSSLTTKSLYRLAGNNKLDGTYVKVLKYPGNSGVTGTNNNFIYSAGDPGIDETMSYYHVDDFRHNYINTIDNNFSLSKLEVLVNAQAVSALGICNGIYNTVNHEILLSDGNGTDCFNTSLEDKVIQHEYTHAVVYDLNSGITSINNNNEEGAISEGLGDYFPGSYKGTAVIGDYVFPYNTNPTYDLDRSMVSPEFDHYSNLPRSGGVVNLGAHRGGEFFSSILWDIRNSPGISNSIIDKIIFEAIKSVNSDPDFTDFRDVMKTKALTIGGTTYVKAIHNRFADKGMGTPFPLTVTISGPIEMDSGTSETWTVSSSDGIPPFSYVWRILPLGQGGMGTIVGYGASYSGTQTDSFDLLVSIGDSQNYSGTDRHFVTVNGGGCQPGFPCKAIPQKELPTEFGLFNNYPNPFNPSTQIKFALPEAADVTINIYNIMGQRVATIINERMEAGFQNATFEASNLASGIYIARLTAVGLSGVQFASEIKMQLIK